MRILFSLLMFCLLQQSAITQTPQPSQKEIQAQMQEAKTEAKKHIAELEKQIAEAKLNEENPETIREMEQQLAMTKKMLGVIDKAGSQNREPKNLPTSKTVKPKYVSPFVPITLKQPVKAPSEEQAKDQLYWYTGKKINANTLITTGGMVVQHDRANKRLIVQPDKPRDTFYYGLVKTLAQATQMQNDFVVRMDGTENSFFMFPEILKAYEEFELLRDRYYTMAKNTIELTPIDDLYTDDEMHEQLKALHQELKTMTENMPEIKRQNLIPSPERPHNLCWCDTTRRMDYEMEMILWPDLLYKDEYKLTRMVQKVLNTVEEFKRKGYTWRPIHYWTDVIFKAQRLAMQRKRDKLELLTERYRDEKNIYKEEALVTAAAAFEADLKYRNWSFPEGENLRTQGLYRVQEVKDILFKEKLFEKYIDRQKADRNFNIVFDYALYTSHEFSKRSMDWNYDVPENLFDIWIEQLNKKYNRFTLTLKMDFELHFVDNNGKKMVTTDGFLQSDPLIVSLGKLGCKWQLYKKEVNHRDKNASDETFHIPMKVMQGKKVYVYLEKDPLYYSGPAYMQMVFPSIRINFCQDANGGEIKDSAYLDVLRYSDADLARFQNADYDNEYSTDMQMYANKLILGLKETMNNVSGLINIAGKMMDIEGITQRPPSKGHPLLDRLMMEFIMNQQRHNLQGELSETSHTKKTVMIFDAAYTTHVLIMQPHDAVDANDKDKELGVKMIRGVILLRVNHSPKP